MRLGVLCVVLAAIGCSSPATGIYVGAGTTPNDAIIADDDSITISPQTITIVGAAGTETSNSAMVTGTGAVTTMTSLAMTDPMGAFRVVTPACPAPPCTFAPAVPLPAQLTIACTPAAMPRFGNVMVTGPNATVAMANLECQATGGAPGLSVPDPPPVSAQVGASTTTPLSITNTGNVALDVSLQFSPSEWSAMMCVAPATCPVAVGDTITIPITFAPIVHGDRSSTLQVTSNPDAGTKFVTLTGTGLGGVLRVDQPATFAHDFGTIAKGQTATFTVQMSNLGNQPITVTPGALGAPYTVQAAPVMINPGGMGTFDVGCMSQTAGGPFPMTLALTPSANVYDANATSLDFDCTIANTTVQVTPNPIAFGELRVGDPAGSIDVTIRNPPGGGAITVESVALAGAPGALTLMPPSQTLPAMVADGQSLTATVNLATAADVTLGDVTLAVTVTEGTTAALSIPVTGKVGTPAAVVVPDQLALGTVCIGTPVMGSVTMTNTGTLTLTMMRPEMTSTSFVPTFTNPTGYPDPPAGVPLLSADSATVGVMPASQDPGRLEGTLEWNVDAPAAPFRVPVTLEYLVSGTAVSPAIMKFGAIDIGAQSPPGVVTLENCGMQPALVSYGGVHASLGPDRAWTLSPPGDDRMLDPGGKMRIMVVFSPTEPGNHRANIQIHVDGDEHDVELDGDAIGQSIERTSFYACNCTSSGAPGWPIAFAAVVVLRRRRRR